MTKKIKKQIKKLLTYFLIFVLMFSQLDVYRTNAESATGEKDTLTDSRPSVYPNHDIKFKMDASTTIANTETVTITFTGFTTGANAIVDGNWEVLHDADGAGSYTALTLTTHYTITEPGTSAADPVVTFTFTAAGATAIGTDKYMEIKLTNSSDKLPNPTAGVKTLSIGGNFGDTGTMKVAIISGVTVSATVAETLTATVAGVTTGNCTVTGGSEIDTSGDAATIPFSTVNSDTFYDACQSLSVATNASDGYSATVQETDQLTNGSSDQIADGTCDGACTDSAEGAWATAGNNGFGYCVDDYNGDGAATADAGWGTNGCGAGTQNFKTIADAGAAETAQAIMSSAAPVSNDQAYIGYRLTVDGAQPAGTYSNTIVYIVTPAY